jgi:hypothetical protein
MSNPIGRKHEAESARDWRFLSKSGVYPRALRTALNHVLNRINVIVNEQLFHNPWAIIEGTRLRVFSNV